VSGPPAQTEPPFRPSESGTAISEQELEGFQHRSTRPSAQPSESSITHPSEKLNSGAVHHLDRGPEQHIGGKVGIDHRGLKSESLTSRKIKRKYVLNKKNTKISPNKERAVAYARVSSKRQVEEGVSLDAQVERLIAYADFRGLDLDPDDIFIEEGVSAATHLWSRPAGREMREIILSGASRPSAYTQNGPIVQRCPRLPFISRRVGGDRSRHTHPRPERRHTRYFECNGTVFLNHHCQPCRA
jgi:hypothetical protein